MRVWGRVPNPGAGARLGIDFILGESQLGGGKPFTWVAVETDANGFNDNVYLTNLAQVLKLNLSESPFFANWGIPAKNSVLQQQAPDFYVTRTQQQFAPFFASLLVQKVEAAPEPSYVINLITQAGSIREVEVPI